MFINLHINNVLFIVAFSTNFFDYEKLHAQWEKIDEHSLSKDYQRFLSGMLHATDFKRRAKIDRSMSIAKVALRK